MKRLLSILVVLIMLLTMMPYSAMAAEEDTYEHDRLIALACEAFPEFAGDIHGESVSISQYSDSDEADALIYQDTRSISECESISIAKSARGAIVIVDSSVTNLSYTLDPVNTTNGVTGTVSFTVTTNQGSGTFKLSNVGFSISYSSSDYFTSYGTPSKSNGYYTVSYAKNSASSTYIHYVLSFLAPNPSYNLYYDFDVSIGNDQISASVWV